MFFFYYVELECLISLVQLYYKSTCWFISIEFYAYCFTIVSVLQIYHGVYVWLTMIQIF